MDVNHACSSRFRRALSALSVRSCSPDSEDAWDDDDAWESQEPDLDELDCNEDADWWLVDDEDGEDSLDDLHRRSDDDADDDADDV